LVCLMSFEISESLKTGISEFLQSKLNYVIMIVVTLLTLYTGVSYLFENKDTDK